MWRHHCNTFFTVTRRRSLFVISFLVFSPPPGGSLRLGPCRLLGWVSRMVCPFVLTGSTESGDDGGAGSKSGDDQGTSSESDISLTPGRLEVSPSASSHRHAHFPPIAANPTYDRESLPPSSAKEGIVPQEEPKRLKKRPPSPSHSPLEGPPTPAVVSSKIVSAPTHRNLVAPVIKSSYVGTKDG